MQGKGQRTAGSAKISRKDPASDDAGALYASAASKVLCRPGAVRTTAEQLVVIMPSASLLVVPCTGAVPSARPALFSKMSTCAAGSAA